MTRTTRMLMVLVVCLAVFPASWADSRGNIGFILGGRVFEDSDTWDPIDEQFALGATFDFGVPTWPVNWSFGVYTSSRDKNVAVGQVLVNRELRTLELSTGITKYWGKKVLPYIGAGFSLIDIEATGVTGIAEVVSDTNLGAYVQGGILFRVGKLFNIGVDGRLLYADAEFGTVDTSAAYYQGALVLGWGW